MILQGDQCYLCAPEEPLTDAHDPLTDSVGGFPCSDHRIFCPFQVLFSEKDTENSRTKAEEKEVGDLPYHVTKVALQMWPHWGNVWKRDYLTFSILSSNNHSSETVSLGLYNYNKPLMLRGDLILNAH